MGRETGREDEDERKSEDPAILALNGIRMTNLPRRETTDDRRQTTDETALLPFNHVSALGLNYMYLHDQRVYEE